jgi:riboflavin synthase
MLRSNVFTGLIVEMGTIASLKKQGTTSVLSLKAYDVASSAKLGDSISVNGVCLTVVDKKDNRLSFDLSEETLMSTNLGSLKVRDAVNLEPSLSPSSKIGGHFVTGHVDGVGKIRSKEPLGDMTKFTVHAPRYIMGFFVEKGSVAVDGISLTVVDIMKNGFSVVIIPHTSKLTTMGFKGPGDTVNIEADILGKYVARFLKTDGDKDIRLMKTLTEKGYL